MSLLTRCLLLIAISFNVYGVETKEQKLISAFHERFEVVKENGKTKRILDRFIQAKFDIRPYVTFILKQSLIEEQKRMANKSAYESEILSYVGDASTFDKGVKLSMHRS